MARAKPIKERLQSFINKVNGCWEWQGSLNSGGYGQMTITNKEGKKTRNAHRVAYETFVGPIPKGLTIDHLCRNRKCVNPSHLEAVTYAVNLARGNPLWKQEAARTHCKHGHEFTAANTYIYGNKRKCKTCNIEANRRNWRKYYYGVSTPQMERLL